MPQLPMTISRNAVVDEFNSDAAKAGSSGTGGSGDDPALQVLPRVLDLIGDRLTCYIAGVRDARTIASWQAKGDVPYVSARRLQLALQTALLLRTQYQPDQIVRWFTWLSDRLGDKSPACVLHSASTEEEFADHARALVGAAKAYLLE